ncbi:RHS repeat-associated core domain-containing protein [Microbulbifer sp. A4B17]|uniref:RHS repeat-associated core domain-containing protein n=1 Tax=Microbulbifer sp. A4B17 TaxID=359370 RepID=UPI0013008AFA|nr:RHS repeat-associated core domain-containing protein [Microbulbifer sp. A4B17]
MRYLQLFLLVLFVLQVGNVLADINVPATSNTGSYTLTYSHSVPDMYHISSLEVVEKKNGTVSRTFDGLSTINPSGSLSITVSTTAQYEYQLKAMVSRCTFIIDIDSGSCGRWATPYEEDGGSDSINVAFKPNTPPNINYTAETIEDGSTTDTNGEFEIYWGASTEGPVVSGYQWCQRTNGSWQSTSSCQKVGKTTRTRTLPTSIATGTMPSGTYAYRVRAYATAGGYYQYSGWRTSSTLNVKHYPDAVGAWLEPGGSTIPGSSFQLKWQSVDDPDLSDPIASYDLEWDVDGKGYTDVFDSGLGNTTTATINEATTGEEITSVIYKFRVRACNESNDCGPWSPIKQLNPPTPPEPEFHEDLETQFFKLDQNIIWKDVGASSYQLKRTRKGEDESGCAEESDGYCWLTVVATTTGTSYFDGGSSPGTYLYKLDACNDLGNCASVLSPWIKVHSLANANEAPAVTTESPDTPGTLPYSSDVSASGNAVINVPLQPAPGVNGLIPAISLYYNSARFQKRMNEALPEDILGYGWSLSGLSYIRRCVINRPETDSVQLDDSDSLCLDGEPLVLVSGVHWEAGAQYRTLRDSFKLIELQENNEGKPWFRVKSPNGSIYDYGSTADSRLRAEESPHFAWSLNKITDAFGNVMEYKYHRDTVEGINYPLEITYGNQGDAKVEFQYGTRTDAPPVPLQEIQQEQLVLLHHIRVYLDDVVQREYKLISEEEPTDPDQEHYRRLKQVQLCAYGEDGSGRQCLNPLEFDWELTSSGNDGDFETGIETITNGLGAQTRFTLERISDNDGETEVGRFSEDIFGTADAIPDTRLEESQNGDYRTVVTKVERSNGYSQGWHSTEYAYQGVGLTSTKNWGFLGYTAQRIYDTEAEIVTYRQYRKDFPYLGKMARQVQYHINYFGELLTSQRFSHDALELAAGSSTTYVPYVAQSLSTIVEGGENIGYTLTDSVPQTTSYGDLGDLVSGNLSTTRIVGGVQFSDAQSVWGEVLPVTSYSDTQRSVESATLLENRVSGQWLIGFASAQEQRHFSGDVAGKADQEVSSTMTPYANTNRVETITRYPGDAQYQMVVSYSYDAYGNVTNETATGKIDSTINGSGTQTRSTTVEGAFDDARYPTSLSNSLSHNITLGYDNRFGSVTRVTDANNQSTSIQYDPFGREVERTNADNVMFSTSYNFCHSLCPTVGGIEVPYWVQTDSPITPVSEYYYDQLGRLVQQDIQAFSGYNVSRRELKYDTQGRLVSETAPFFAQDLVAVDGEKPLVGYEYDLRNRLDRVERADGSTVEIDYAVNFGSTKQVKVSVTESVLGSTATTSQVRENYYNLNGELARTIDDATGEAVVTDYTYYATGLPKTVKVTGDSRNIESSFVFDYAGFRTSLQDPNLGTVSSSYNAFGELDRQTDNKGQSITFLYDQLGRLLEQQDNDGLAKWYYDAANAKGGLQSRAYTENGSQVFYEEYSYQSDSKLDGISTQLLAGGVSRNYQHQYGYDNYGRTNKVTYPNSVEAHYHYSDRGYMQSLSSDAAGNNSLQTFDNMNAWGQVEQETYGNGLVTTRTYNPDTGRLETIKTGGGAIQNNEYQWRSNGTLESRLSYSSVDVLQKQEDFTYDGLNRLTSASLVVGGDRVLSTQYDKLGNILSKSSSVATDAQVADYQYGEFGNAGPNAVSNVKINGISQSLYYDANGAIEHYDAATGDDKWISWNARQLPTEIVLGGSQSDATPTARDRFQYGPNGQRFYRESSWMEDGQLKTEKAFIVGSYEEQIPADASILTIEKTQLAGNVQHIAITDLIGTSGEYQYLHRDHLGSIEKITDEAGLEILDLSFNPDGSRRQTDWGADLDQQGLQELLAVQGLTTKRGYTGHEHLDRTGLIHMNGRIYDPTLGRFLSPDPIVQAPTYSQNWNRYSYVFNNPLSFTDPSGFSAKDKKEDTTKPKNEGQTSDGGNGSSDGDNGSSDGWDIVVTGNSYGPGIYTGSVTFGGNTYYMAAHNLISTWSADREKRYKEQLESEMIASTIADFRAPEFSLDGVQVQIDLSAQKSLNPFKIIGNEFPQWWSSEETKDLRVGMQASADIASIPFKGLAVALDVKTAISIIDSLSQGDYGQVGVDTASLLAGKGTVTLLTDLTKSPKMLQSAVGVGVDKSTNYILQQDCLSCNEK